jgi:hypothetical protein
MAKYTILVEVPDSVDQEAVFYQLRQIMEDFKEETSDEFKIPVKSITVDVQPESA